jgi:hypothetical protein
MHTDAPTGSTAPAIGGSLAAISAAMFVISFDLVLFELVLTRLFGVVLFAQFAHLALALALLGISVGAIAQHLRPGLVPEDGLERRLGRLALLQAVASVVAVICTLSFPVTVQFAEPPSTYQERSTLKDELLDPVWFAALLPILAMPFAIAGLAFAGVFERRRVFIGRLYGADLIGGAAGAVVFLPALAAWAAPDVVFVLTLTGAIAALWLARVAKDRIGQSLSVVMIVGSLCALVYGLGGEAGRELLRVRYAAGYDERNITYNRWTPLTRVSVHEGERGVHMLLDNTSASQVFRSEAEQRDLSRQANRSLVYRLHKGEEACPVAILAASAGPEVAIAQSEGWSRIDAIDIAGEVMHTVRERFADSPVNPYTRPGVALVESDGRAAILHAKTPYCIIQMVHANLWSSAGLVSNAWSPSLLETEEAFLTYLDHLDPNGTLSFGRGSDTPALSRAAAAALRKRGVAEPQTHMAYIQGNNTLLLVKPRPWTEAEVERLEQVLRGYPGSKLTLHPMKPASTKVEQDILQGPVMTDDRPYLDDPRLVAEELAQIGKEMGEGDRPLAAVWRSIVIQVGFALIAGLAFIGLPMLRRSETAQLQGTAWAILYVAGLGYGYLAVETVLIHELVLFVGHPTYAVTVVILAMLLASGLGSVFAGRLADRTPNPVSLERHLRAIFIAILALGLLQTFVVSPALTELAQGAPTPLRAALTFGSLLPIGFLMGMPFPTGLRLLRPEASPLVPWAWAINGWMSVVASLTTVMLSRMFGYHAAFLVALLAYAIALASARALPLVRIRQ